MVALLLCYSVHSSHHRVPYIYIHIGGGLWDFRFFGFCHFFASTSVFRFCCALRFPGFPFLASGFRFLAKIKRFSDFGDRCAFLVFLI